MYRKFARVHKTMSDAWRKQGNVPFQPKIITRDPKTPVQNSCTFRLDARSDFLVRRPRLLLEQCCTLASSARRLQSRPLPEPARVMENGGCGGVGVWGRTRKAGSRTQKAESRKQKAESRSGRNLKEKKKAPTRAADHLQGTARKNKGNGNEKVRARDLHAGSHSERAEGTRNRAHFQKKLISTQIYPWFLVQKSVQFSEGFEERRFAVHGSPARRGRPSAGARSSCSPRGHSRRRRTPPG